MSSVESINVGDLVKRLVPGDIGLTRNPDGLGKLINFGQRIEQGDASEFGHIFIVAKAKGGAFYTDGRIYESVKKITINPLSNYIGSKLCVMRHKNMDMHRYYEGREEILDNIGQIYPGHRLVFHGLDMVNSWIVRKVSFGKLRLSFRLAKQLPLDWPVCSELGAQFVMASGLEAGFPAAGWRGVNPDHFDDARQNRPDLWDTVFYGNLIA